MPEKDKITEQKVKYSGIFDFRETYQFIHRWLIEEGYKVEEQKYQEQIQGEEKNIEIKWVAEKNISDYFRNEIKITFRMYSLKKIEVEKNGKRVKTNEGGFEAGITGNLVKDYENTWEKRPSMKFLRGVYDKYIIEGTIKKYSKALFDDVQNLSEQIKEFLSIEAKK